MSKRGQRSPFDSGVKLGIPTVTTDPESLRRAATSIISAIEQLTRQRGDIGHSAVTVYDLLQLNLIPPELVNILDPGGSYYTQRGVAQLTDVDPANDSGSGSSPSAPIEHGHSWNDLTDIPTAFYPAAHQHPWVDISGKPATYPPDPHTHDWTELPDHAHTWFEITGLPDNISQLAVVDAAAYQFSLADSIPYKQFVYDTGLLVTINLYDDAGLTNLRYKKDLLRTGDFLTSIVLTRYPDEAQWTKTLTYNLEDALETVATVAV